MIKVVGVCGSPRLRGNSNTLLRTALQGAAGAGAVTETVNLYDMSYSGCRACPTCMADGRCTIRDALTPLLAALKLADVWVFAAPIYYDGVSGPFKTFFDRCRCFTRYQGVLKPQLSGRRRAGMIITYADESREDYLRTSTSLLGYLSWMGDFGSVPILAGSNLGPADAAGGRADLLEAARAMGGQLVRDLAAPA